MEDTCNVDMTAVSKGLASRLQPTVPLDSEPSRQKTSFNHNSIVNAVILTLVLTGLIFTFVDRRGFIRRIELLETEVHNQKGVIVELHESLKYLQRLQRSDARFGYGTSEVPGENDGDAHNKLKVRDDVTDETANTDDVIRGRREREIRHNVRLPRDDTQEDDVQRVIRTAPTTNLPSPQPRRGRVRPGRGERPKPRKNRVSVEGTNGTSLCDALDECNSFMDVTRPLVAHFVPRQIAQGPQFINATNDLLGNWEHADWMYPRSGIGHQGFKIRGHSPSRSKIRVAESGIYYVYSQVSFSDDAYFLGHSIMVNGELKFTCTLWASDGFVDANTCHTGGLVRINAGQEVAIRLIQANRVINTDHKSTFFGLMRWVSLPPVQES